jgi:hypothetical protein
VQFINEKQLKLMPTYIFDIALAKIEKRYNQIWYLHIMAALLVLVFTIRGLSNLPETAIQLWIGVPILLGLIYLITIKKNELLTTKVNRWVRLVEAATISLASYHFFKYDYTFVGIAFAISAIMILFTSTIEHQILNGVQIKIDDNGINRNIGLGSQTTIWEEVSNVIINSNLLTVDLKNNHLLQVNFKNELSATEIETFNKWCKGKIRI